MTNTIQKFKGKKSNFGRSLHFFLKKHSKVFYLLIAVVILLVAGLVAYYVVQQESVTVPEIETPPSINNSALYFKSEANFVVNINKQHFVAEKKADNLYETNIDLNDGIYDYTLSGLKQNRLFTVKSKPTVTKKIKIDKTKPQIKEENVATIYHEPKQVIEFKSSEPVTVTINNQDATCTNEKASYKCNFEFTKEGKQELSIVLKDKANNTTTLTTETLYTPKPLLNCGQLPIETNQAKINLECTVNKEGTLLVNNKEINTIVKAPFPVEIELSTEGKNIVPLVFTDTYNLNSTIELVINKDSTAPTAEFNFLDTKKVFQQGTVGVGFISNENAKAKVRFYPINNFFETDALAKQILGSGNFVYEGGQTFEADVVAGQAVSYTTPNNFALCQILSATNKNCFSPGIVGIEVILKDKFENTRTYLCNNWLATDTAKLEGLEATTCQERK